MPPSGVSRRTTVLAHSLIWKIPKKLGNLLNFKHLFLTRMGEGLFPYIELRGFERFLHGPGRGVRNAMLGSVESVIARQLKLRQCRAAPRPATRDDRAQHRQSGHRWLL